MYPSSRLFYQIEIENQGRRRVRKSMNGIEKKVRPRGDVPLYLSSKSRDTVEEERVLHENRLTPERFLEHRSFNPGHSKGQTLL
jgi:hypothetical protein